MSPAPRPVSPPKAVVGCWAVSVAAGVYLVITPTGSTREPSALSPYSVAAYLREVAPDDARDVRVNGLYGSGHGGAWQFIAHLTWREPEGEIAGGTTNLPILAGGNSIQSSFDAERLDHEHAIAWSLDDLDSVLDSFDDVDAPLAMVEFEPTGTSAVITHCGGDRTEPAACEVRQRDGDVVSRERIELTDEPLQGPLAVQRR